MANTVDGASLTREPGVGFERPVRGADGACHPSGTPAQHLDPEA
jgi:hypothetical protein